MQMIPSYIQLFSCAHQVGIQSGEKKKKHTLHQSRHS